MRHVVLRLATVTARVSCSLVFILGAALHVLTVLVAFRGAALWGATLTAIVPVVAEIYWFGSLWSDTGRFLNFYTVAVGMFLAVAVAAVLSVAIVALASDSMPESK